MTNADIFKQTFGIYATELWAMSEQEFTDWLNTESDIEVSVRKVKTIITALSKTGQERLSTVPKWY